MILSLSTCVKNEIDMSKISNAVDWNPKLGIPLAHGSLSLKDLIDAVDSAGLIKEYPDGLLYLTYRTRILSKTIDSVFTIPSQQYQEIFRGSDLPGFPGPDSLVYRRNSNYTFSFTKGEEIDSVNFKSGALVFSVSSEFFHKGRITITMTSLTKNGRPLQFSMPINVGDGTFSDSIIYNLRGYKLTLNSGNQMPFTYEVVFGDPGQPTLSTQKMTVDVNVRQPSFRSFFGYIADYPVIDNFSGQMKIDVFDNVLSSDIQFADPRFKVYYSNSFGIPIRIQLSNLRTSSNTRGLVNLILNPSVNPIDVAYPNINQIGKWVYDSIQIDNSNSNLSAAFNIAPQLLNYSVNAVTNPTGKTFNFALDTSRLDLDLAIELPIDIKASNYQMSDTISFDLSGIVSDYSIVNKIAIYATFNNAIPFDLSLQVFLADQNYTIVDSLFTTPQQPIIKSGEVNNNGKVVNPVSKITQVTFDGARAKPLEKVKYAIVRGNITTAGNGKTYVKFYSSYILDVALGVQVDLKIRSLDQL